MTIKDGRFIEELKQEILDQLIARAKGEFGDDLNDTQTAAIRMYYDPIADLLAEAQVDIGLVLDSAQLKYAEGDALDLLTALIGVPREPARTARGYVKFNMPDPDTVDHVIQKNTMLGTNSTDPIRFTTTDAVTIASGETTAEVDVVAVEAGAQSNVGPNTVTVFPSGGPGAGISVTNPKEIDGGEDAETDDELRERAQEELADGSRASGPALISAIKSVDGVTDVTIFINDTADVNGRGYNLPPRAFELVVQGGDPQDVADRIIETKAAGDPCIHGENGESAGQFDVELPNGQLIPVGFSRAADVYIYVDATIEVTEDYAGAEDVRTSIVDYIGGYTPTGFEQDGRLAGGDDVLIGEIEFAIRKVPGVYDVTNLTIGKSASPTGTTNIPIANQEQAIIDAQKSNQHITLTKVEVTGNE